jgi:alkyldihydroxyacetonephosphate synthase
MQRGEAPSVLRLYDGADSVLSSAVPVTGGDPDRVHAGAISRAGAEHSGPREHTEAEEPTPLDQLAQRVNEMNILARVPAARRIVGEILGRPQLANAVLDRLPQRPRLVIGLEGGPDDLLARVQPLRALLEQRGAKDLGDAAGEKWLKHRHRVSYKMSKAFGAGGWVDTFEVATGWQGVVALHKEMRAALSDVVVVLCHMSHAYPDGCSLYFTFAGGGGPGTGPRSALGRYDLAWSRALAVTRRHGAAASHHHGVGRAKVSALRHSPGAQRLLRQLKRTLDPDNLLNPGVLGIGAVS